MIVKVGEPTKPNSEWHARSSQDQTESIRIRPGVVKCAAEPALQPCHETTTFTFSVRVPGGPPSTKAR